MVTIQKQNHFSEQLCKVIEQNIAKIYSLAFFTFPYFNVLSNSPTLSILYKKQSRCDPQFNNWFII